MHLYNVFNQYTYAIMMGSVNQWMAGRMLGHCHGMRNAAATCLRCSASGGINRVPMRIVPNIHIPGECGSLVAQYNTVARYVRGTVHSCVVGSGGETTEDVTVVASPTTGFTHKWQGVDSRLEGGMADELRISEPTAVQQVAIPHVIAGRNVAIQCYTGSGKTLAYLLPALTIAMQKSDEEWSRVTRKTRGEAGKVHCVIVAPSRELAMQIVRVAHAVLPPQASRSVQQCIGGANIHRQREALKLNKPMMVVGTPGRLAELSKDGTLQTHNCGLLIMDEIDQLLAPQFREDMVRITEHTGKKCTARQTVIVSATMTARVLAMSNPWCPNPEKIFIDATGNPVEPPKDEDVVAPSVLAETARVQGEFPSRGWGDPDEVFPEGIPITTSSAGGFGGRASTPSMAPSLTHLYISSPPQHKVDALRRSLHATGAQRALVFMNFQHRLKDTAAKLKTKKISAASLHGEMTKTQRQNALDSFRKGKVRVLLVSDVAARGLDIPECDAVVNLELPSDPAHYAHRAGRTGRAGREGVVISLVSEREKFVVEKFGSKLGIDIAQVENKFGSIVPVRSRRET